MLVPMQSDCLKITGARPGRNHDRGRRRLQLSGGGLRVLADRTLFCGGARDLRLRASRRRLDVLKTRAVSSVEVTVAESPLQEARYRVDL